MYNRVKLSLLFHIGDFIMAAAKGKTTAKKTTAKKTTAKKSTAKKTTAKKGGKGATSSKG